MQNTFAQTLIIKVLIKLSKIYLELCNHFKAKRCLREARDFLKANPNDLADGKKLMVRYRDAKCQFHMKMAVIPKFKKNLDIFKELTKEEPHSNLKRSLRGIFYNLIAACNK